jgi:2-oxo-3-hexenedioate decarboxylase
MSERIESIARRLDDAAQRVQAIAQPEGADAPRLDEAYAVQAALVACRLRRGAKRIGMKMGFTSRAKMQQMGLSELIWGRLTSDMVCEEGGALAFDRFIHPRIEPEVCYLLRKPLAGVVTLLEALDAVEAVAPALEVIDSRYRDFRFSLADVIADNASSAGVVIGPWQRPERDVANLGIVLTIDGRAAQVGTTAAILGHPLRSLVAAARLVAAAGERLEPGSLVMAGGATAAVELRPGAAVSAEFQGLGRIGLLVGAAERAA